MMIIDRMFFTDNLKDYIFNKKARVENSFNQLFKEIGLPLPNYKFVLNEDETEVIEEYVELGIYRLNVRITSVEAIIREITKFVVEYQRSDSCYYTGDILRRGIVGLYKDA